MELIDFVPTPDQYAFTFGGYAPVRSVKPGTAMRIWSEDAFSDTIHSADDVSAEKMAGHLLNPQSGPFHVEGAEPGDTLAVHVVDLEPARDWGASATIPFFGSLTSTDRTAMLQEALPDLVWIYELDRARNTVTFASKKGDFSVDLPVNCMLGTLGVAPAGLEARSALEPERFGGNMDTPELTDGATLYLKVNVEGALFSLGDGHYRQGEGEACGTAVEGRMNSTIIVDLIKAAEYEAPQWPRLENDTHWMTVGSSRPLEDAWRIGSTEMIRWLQELYDLDAMDAYQLFSQISLAPIANVVDVNFSSMAKVPKDLLPAASAYGGLHADLRERARQLR